MISRKIMMPLALVSAVGGPFAAYESGMIPGGEGSTKQATSKWFGNGSGGSSDLLATASPLPPTDIGTHAPPPPLMNTSMEQVFSFNVTQGWVMRNWPRVSTQLGELGLHGYRVALVSGIREDDVAGSLTYYFDRNDQLQRIVFEGTTGDPRRLTALVGSQFELQRNTSTPPDVTLYQKRWNGKVMSQLVIEPNAIISADDPHGRFVVSMFLHRPAKLKTSSEPPRNREQLDILNRIR